MGKPGRPKLTSTVYETEYLLDTKQVAEKLGVNYQTAVQWFRDGWIQTYSLPGGKKKYTTKEALLRWARVRHGLDDLPITSTSQPNNTVILDNP